MPLRQIQAHFCTTKHPSTASYCSKYDKRFGVKIGTAMEQFRIGYRNWAIATYLLTTHPKGISGARPGRDPGISQRSTWFLLRRRRDVWRTPAGPDLMADLT